MENERLIAQPVRSLQTMLRTISRTDSAVPPVVPDGIYGRQTMAAVTAFQKSAGLPITGVVDADSWSRLRTAYMDALSKLNPERLWMSFDANETIAPGAAAMQMHVVQSIFMALQRVFTNVPAVEVTGRNDEQSTKALRWLQRMAEIPETGALDMRTWQRLSRLYSTAVIMDRQIKKEKA